MNRWNTDDAAYSGVDDQYEFDRGVGSRGRPTGRTYREVRSAEARADDDNPQPLDFNEETH